MAEDASVMLLTKQGCLVEEPCSRGDRRDANQGATPARARPLVAVDHLGVSHRRRGAGTGQSSLRCSRTLHIPAGAHDHAKA
jgi:hypothetical protein